MTVYFQTLKVKISSYEDIKRPELNENGSVYIIYSPEKFKLRLRDSNFLNLKFKLTVPEKLEVHINLLSYLKECFLSKENQFKINNMK